MRVRRLIEKMGKSLVNNWWLIWRTIMIAIAALLIIYVPVHIEHKEMQDVYVGQEMRIYDNIDKGEIFISGNLYMCNETDEYIGIIATKAGKYEIKRNSKTLYLINVKNGIEYDSYVVLKKSNLAFDKFWALSMIVVICGFIFFIPFIIMRIKEKVKKRKEILQKSVVKKDDLKFN